MGIEEFYSHHLAQDAGLFDWEPATEGIAVFPQRDLTQEDSARLPGPIQGKHIRVAKLKKLLPVKQWPQYYRVLGVP